jgi:hemin uptake protein HemP
MKTTAPAGTHGASRPPRRTAEAAAPAGAPPPRLLSSQLFGKAPEVLIDHNAQVYRLRRTALGKLILTK